MYGLPTLDCERSQVTRAPRGEAANRLSPDDCPGTVVAEQLGKLAGNPGGQDEVSQKSIPLTGPERDVAW